MFGFNLSWVGRAAQKIRRKKFVPNPDHYPMDTNRHFYDFIVSHVHLTEGELANRVLSMSSKRSSKASLLDCIHVTHNAVKGK